MKLGRFRFSVGFTLFWLAFFLLFCFLGVWQLHRYQFKKNLLEKYQERLLAVPENFSNILKEKDLTFQHIIVSGEYLNDETLFVQNQFYHDEVGFEVLTPFKISNDNQLLLIDRGWIAKSKDTPIIAPVNGKQTITGHIKLLNEYQFILGDNILYPNVKPIVMQKIDIADISRITHLAYYPFIVRLDVKAPNGFQREMTTVTTIMPERHMGYAIQWFAMAFVLLVAYFCFCYEREGKNAK